MRKILKESEVKELEFKRLNKKEIDIDMSSIVALKSMNNIMEICYCSNRNSKANIINIDKDFYYLTSTGEIKEKNHIESRAEDLASVSQSLKRLRDYINYNVVDSDKCLWITLTYKENMTDTKRLYKDFRDFVKRFRYKYGHFEYIVACEPQGRGAWHLHCIFIFDKTKPYIPNNELAICWGQGFTKTKRLNNVDNIGAYITAYLGDIDLNEAVRLKISPNFYQVKEIDEIDGEKLKVPKKVLKGARMVLYPPKFNLYRISKGIKKPPIELMTYKEAKEKIGNHAPTYSSGLDLILPNNTSNNSFKRIIYEYYNTKR